MATEYVGSIYANQFGQRVPLERVGKSFGEDVSGLVVGANVADVDSMGRTNFRKPMQINPVGTSDVCQLVASTFLKDTYSRSVIFKNVKFGRKLPWFGRVQIISPRQTGTVRRHAPHERTMVDFAASIFGVIPAPTFAGQKYGMMASQRSMIGNAAFKPVLSATTSASHVE